MLQVGASYVAMLSFIIMVVFIGCGSNKSINDGDMKEVITLALNRAVVQKKIPDYELIQSPEHIILSTEHLPPGWEPKLKGVKIQLLTPEKIQEKANAEGKFLYLKFEKIQSSNSVITVPLNNVWASPEDSKVGHTSGGGFEIKYRYKSGRWVPDDPIKEWIS